MTELHPCLQSGDFANCYNPIFNKDPKHQRNRNAAGFLWMGFLLDHAASLDHADFRHLSTHFCSVSGSPVTPQRPGFGYRVDAQGDLHHASPDEATHVVHHCCRPCVCDLQEGARVASQSVQLKDKRLDVDFLVLKDDPCSEQKGAPGPLRTLSCKNAPAIHCTADGKVEGARYAGDRPIIGIAHGLAPAGDADRAKIYPHTRQDTLQYCAHKAQGGHRIGMGQIFRIFSGKSKCE